MTAAEFWEATPREVQLAVRAWDQRQLESIEVAIIGAYHAVRFDRAKRPDLDATLKSLRAARKKRQVPLEAELARWKAFFAGARRS